MQLREHWRVDLLKHRSISAPFVFMTGVTDCGGGVTNSQTDK